MRRLPPWVRHKAIEIANALLDEGMDEGKAIRIAIAKAKQWAARRVVERVGVKGSKPDRRMPTKDLGQEGL